MIYSSPFVFMEECKSRFLLVLYNATHEQLNFLISNFVGTIANNVIPLNYTNYTYIYLGGDISGIACSIEHSLENIFVIKDLSKNYENYPFQTIDIGMVPINVHNVGVLFPRCFGPNNFQKISQEHRFQSLTESTKETNAFRKGIYLTNVKETGLGTEFNLLRCSTNLDGPTENFTKTDQEIVNT